MFNQITSANTNTEQTLDDVLDDFRLEASQADIIRRAANKVLAEIPDSEVPQFLDELRLQIEAVQESIIDSPIHDIVSVVRATIKGKPLSFYSHKVPSKAIQEIVINLAA